MIFSVFACTKKDGDKPGTTTDPTGTTPGPAGTTPTVTTTENKDIPDFPNITFDSASFRVATKEGLMRTEVWADETSTNIREQAIWERNADVEKLIEQYEFNKDSGT